MKNEYSIFTKKTYRHPDPIDFTKLENEMKPPEYLPDIKVKDIKAFLVQEFETSKDKDKQILELETVIDDLRVTATKYDAAMVTLHEYSDRLSRKDDEINRLNNKLTLKESTIDQLNDKVNTLKLNEYKYKEFRIQVEQETKQIIYAELIEKVNNHKGNLSKGELKRWLDAAEEVPND